MWTASASQLRGSPSSRSGGGRGRTSHLLAALVEHELGHDLVAGDVFLFISRNRRSAKVLLWDGTGLCLVCKRLARGRFTPLWERVKGEAIQLSQRELRLLLDGQLEQVGLSKTSSLTTKR